MKDGPKERPRALLLMGSELGGLIVAALEHGHYETRIASGATAATAIAEWHPHLVIVDLDADGKVHQFIGRGISHGQPPILALTRKRDTAIKLAAYEAGVDDIIEVPFTLDEVVARAYALMRRAHRMEVPIVPRVKLDSLDVDLLEQRVRVDGRSLTLTALQQTLLYLLAANAGKVLSREVILETIWGPDFEAESNVVDRHIRELRVKLEDDWRTPRYIETIPGEGYRFRTHAEGSPN
jgi:two-component system KDP operon response regulator KdpE